MQSFLIGLLSLVGVFSTQVYAQPINIPDKPLYVGGGVKPMVMLNISKDDQLHFKAYNDYTDLDNDGVLERTYKHSISYYGYFDTKQCYAYITGTGQNLFKSVGYTPDKYCSGAWSGNFLNWATMTRMDVVRKVLYGGTRSVDTATQTVLQRNYLPSDAHAYSKYYGGTDLGRLTPFNSTPMAPMLVKSANADGTPAARNIPVSTSGDLNTNFHFTTDLRDFLKVGDQVKVYPQNNPAKYFIAPLNVVNFINNRTGIAFRLNAAGSVGGTLPANTSDWVVENLTMKEGGISMCNLTTNFGNGVNDVSQTNVNSPLIKVARGNFDLWAANERYQCQWFEQRNGSSAAFGGLGSNNNNAPLTGILASTENPIRDTHGLGTGSARGEYVAKVEVCNPTYIVDGTDEKDLGKCKLYGNSWKPIGLLQTYGDNDLIRFGLMTGSYQKNVSGGVLRKNISDLSDEIDFSNGTFKAKPFTTTSPPTGSIIRTIDRMKIFGFGYVLNTYQNDNCHDKPIDFPEGTCRSFGNPMSAIYYESMRYLAGKTQTAAYNYAANVSTNADNILGLAKATWTDPLNADNFCSPLNAIVFSSTSKHDIHGSNNIGNNTLADISSPVNNMSITSATNIIGDKEGLTGKKAFVGVNSTSSPTDADYRLCTAKTISGLGEINGICPESPGNQGTYHMAGIADYVKNNRIRTFSNVPIDDKKSLKVTSYGIQLASSTPEIKIPINGKNILLKPIMRYDESTNSTGPFGSGTLVDFKIVNISPDSTSGTAYINWGKFQQGDDFEQDMYGTISWEIVSGKLKITTRTISDTVNQRLGFGYSLSGTNKDGPHFHSGIASFNFTDPTNITVYNARTNAVLNHASTGKVNLSGGCRSCLVTDDATYVLYDIIGDTSQELKDPLYYLAKYGGYTDKNANGKPDLDIEWDSVNNTTGVSGSDGIPDNYFFAINPLLLESSLQQAFNAILVTSSSSSVSANSTFLNNNSLIYQAKYFTGDWSGELTAYKPNSLGFTVTQWEADQLINLVPQNSRQIATYNETSRKGVPLRWVATPSTNTISVAIKDAFNKNPAGLADGQGDKRMLWSRGSSIDEGVLLKKRLRTKLGDIIDSSPVFVSEAQTRVNDPTFDIYYANQKFRTPMIYVGANDGMLHAFNANTGDIKFSYMPSKIARGSLVSKISSQNYGTSLSPHVYGVNGSTVVADIKFGQPCDPTISSCTSDSEWRTVLVSGLAHGGQAVFALDVTKPNDLTEAKAADVVLWEFSDSDDNGLGYSFGQPQITRICTSRATAITYPAKCLTSSPAAIFSSGYNSSTGISSLYVVNLQTGALIKKIPVPGGSPSQPNGLATVSLVDIDNDGVVESGYAGDLLGNMWKFDLLSSTTAKIAFSNVPLYKASIGAVSQPITSAPELYKHPKGGYLVMFGTGKYLEGSDLGNMTQQSFYSIWDKNSFVPTLSDRSNLQVQSISSTLFTDSDNNEYRTSSVNTIDYNTKLGWYMDMAKAGTADQGERIVYSAKIINSGIVTFSSLIPGGGSCTFGGYSWNYYVDILSGASLDNSPFDTVGLPLGISNKKSKNGIVTPSTLLYVGNGIAFSPQSGSSGELSLTRLNLSGGKSGRLSWRELNK